MSYATILKDLKKHVKPDELGFTVHGIREVRSKDLLIELKCSKEGRGRLNTTLKEVIGASETVCHLIPRIGVEIVDIEPSIEADDVENAVRGFFDHASELEFEVSFTKRPYRGNRKAYVLLEEGIISHRTIIKIGWVVCRIRQKMKINRSYRCLGFGHMAANCREHDRSRSYWRCVEEGHTAGSCTRKPQCYLCSAKESKPWDDHIRGQYVARLFGRQPRRGSL